MIEPAVCVPSASGTWQSATAAAEPDDEPPGVCAGLRGLRVLPGPKNASSVVTVLPRMTAPAALSCATTAASAVGRRPAKMGLPFSVGRSAVSMMSLMPTGTPCSGPMTARTPHCVGRARLGQREVGVEMRPGLHLRLALGDALEAGDDERLRRQIAAPDRPPPHRSPSAS